MLSKVSEKTMHCSGITPMMSMSRWICDQDRNFELGAVAINHSYKRTLDIINELEIKTLSFQTNRVFLNNDGKEIDIMSKPEKIKFMWQVLVHLPYLYLKHRNIFKPGFKNISRELYKPFEYFCRKNNLDIFEKFSNIVCAPYGYGYFERVPTAYYFKYLSSAKGVVIELL